MNPKHCTECGAAFSEAERLDKVHPHCDVCKTTNWQNARPVVVFLQPVFLERSLGIAVAKRGIAPDIGKYVLPGGFIEKGETSVQAAAREFGEEAGVPGLVRWETCQVIGDLPSASKEHLLTFVVNKTTLSFSQFLSLKDTDEMHDWAVRSHDIGPVLGWSTHEAVVAQWLKLTPHNRGQEMIRNEEVFNPGFLRGLINP